MKHMGMRTVPFINLFVLAALGAGSASFADDKGWVLTQKSVQFGDQYLYITENGMKVYSPRAGFAFVTHAPDWTCFLYNEKTRCYFQTTVERWRADLRARGIGVDAAGTIWNPGSKANIAGLPASSYTMHGSTLHASKNVATYYSSADYWVADQIKVPQQLSLLMSTMYGVPTTHKVPLRLLAVERGTQKTMLDTYRMQQTSIPISYFSCPEGLTPVKTEAEVMMNDEQKEIMNDMVRDLDPDKQTAQGAGPGLGSTAAAQVRSPSGYYAAPAPSSSAPSSTVNVGGLNLDRAKVKKFLDALKTGNQN